jgi:hypothetical protein
MIVVENSNIFLFFTMLIKNNMRITSGIVWTAILMMKFGCASLPPSSLEFLYADTDSAESKIDKPIVAIIRMISVWSMRFIPITS